VVGRELALKRFAGGYVDLLLAIKCLDEGVDIPWCKGAVIIASSTSSAEFIQRRGRILRKHPSKEYASVFDISVLPFDPDLGPAPMQAVTEAEKGILRKEMARIQLFLRDADNLAVEHVRILKILEMFKRMSVIGKARGNDK
jgi:superfamily II DNA or RNA helicase